MIDRRVTVIPGDVGRDGLGLDDDGRAALASCDIVIHSRGGGQRSTRRSTRAVEVNLLGPMPHRRDAALDLGVRPHLVAVSTCYVAGNRRGAAPEQLLSESPFFLDIDWRDEVDAARRARADAEAESRTPEMLAPLPQARPGRELGAAGVPAAGREDRAARARSGSRSGWSKPAGPAPASLGWPDAYAYTKALGERALVETRGDVPVSIVRPSIIESALAEPGRAGSAASAWPSR